MYSSDVDYHREFLGDQARVTAFRRAIREVVKPGDVVLDLGAGTGIMGLLACRAGAKRVYSIEEGRMIELAREICQANGFGDRVVFLKGFSTQVNLPEKVDVVVADQIGPFGFEAGLLEFFSDARERFLKPGSSMIPSHLDLCVAPVECPEMFAEVEFWNNSTSGFDLRAARSLAVNTGYLVKFHSDQLLGPPVSAASLELTAPVPTSINLYASTIVTRSGILHGIGGWFSARLSENVILSNSPFATTPIKRRNVFFPIDQPVTLEKGNRVAIGMHILPTQLVVTWRVEVIGNSDIQEGEARDVRKNRFTHSTFKGMVVCKEDLQKTLPHFIPKLSPWGEARRSVVNLCDGQRTLLEIEQEVYHLHPQLFPSFGNAAEFVAEVVTRYSL